MSEDVFDSNIEQSSLPLPSYWKSAVTEFLQRTDTPTFNAQRDHSNKVYHKSPIHEKRPKGETLTEARRLVRKEKFDHLHNQRNEQIIDREINQFKTNLENGRLLHKLRMENAEELPTLERQHRQIKEAQQVRLSKRRNSISSVKLDDVNSFTSSTRNKKENDDELIKTMGFSSDIKKYLELNECVLKQTNAKLNIYDDFNQRNSISSVKLDDVNGFSGLTRNKKENDDELVNTIGFSSDSKKYFEVSEYALKQSSTKPNIYDDFNHMLQEKRDNMKQVNRPTSSRNDYTGSSHDTKVNPNYFNRLETPIQEKTNANLEIISPNNAKPNIYEDLNWRKGMLQIKQVNRPTSSRNGFSSETPIHENTNLIRPNETLELDDQNKKVKQRFSQVNTVYEEISQSRGSLANYESALSEVVKKKKISSTAEKTSPTCSSSDRSSICLSEGAIDQKKIGNANADEIGTISDNHAIPAVTDDRLQNHVTSPGIMKRRSPKLDASCLMSERSGLALGLRENEDRNTVVTCDNEGSLRGNNQLHCTEGKTNKEADEKSVNELKADGHFFKKEVIIDLKRETSFEITKAFLKSPQTLPNLQSQAITKIDNQENSACDQHASEEGLKSPVLEGRDKRSTKNDNEKTDGEHTPKKDHRSKTMLVQKFIDNTVKRYYWNRWRQRVSLRKAERSEEQKWQEKINNFMLRLDQQAQFEKKTEISMEAEKRKVIRTPATPQLVPRKTRVKTTPLVKSQKEKEKDVKLAELLKASKESAANTREHLRPRTVHKMDSQVRGKAKLIRIMTEVIDHDRRTQEILLKPFPPPKILIETEQKQKLRQQRLAEIAERKRIIEQERDRIAKQKYEHQLMEAVMEKRRKLMEFREKMRRERIEQEARKQEWIRMKIMTQRAVNMYTTKLLSRYGLTPWVKLIELRWEQRARAEEQNERRIKRYFLLTWKESVDEIQERKEMKAQLFWRRRVLRLSLTTWKSACFDVKLDWQVAEDWYDYKLTEKSLRQWLDFVYVEQEELRYKWGLAVNFYNRKQMTVCLKQWMLLPQVLFLEREKEQRRRALREKVQQVLPDFLPTMETSID